jgi:hypothetical protein
MHLSVRKRGVLVAPGPEGTPLPPVLVGAGKNTGGKDRRRYSSVIVNSTRARPLGMERVAWREEDRLSFATSPVAHRPARRNKDSARQSYEVDPR